jgi:hypothetical protein
MALSSNWLTLSINYDEEMFCHDSSGFMIMHVPGVSGSYHDVHDVLMVRASRHLM